MALSTTIKNKTKKVFGYLAAIQTYYDKYPPLRSLLDFAQNGKFDRTFNILLELLKRIGFTEEDLVNWVANMLAEKRGKTGDGILNVIEHGIKGALLANVTQLFSCDTMPFIPDRFFENVTDTLHGESKGVGIEINLDKIDLYNTLSKCPTSDEGKYFYFDARIDKDIEVEKESDIPKEYKETIKYKYTDPKTKKEKHTTDKDQIPEGVKYTITYTKNIGYEMNDLWKSRDFNAYLWYVVNKSSDANNEHRIWDNRNNFGKIKTDNGQDTDVEHFSNNDFKNEFFKAHTTDFKKDKNGNIVKDKKGNPKYGSTITFKVNNKEYKKKEIFTCKHMHRTEENVNCDILKVYLNEDRYYKKIDLPLTGNIISMVNFATKVAKTLPETISQGVDKLHDDVKFFLKLIEKYKNKESDSINISGLIEELQCIFKNKKNDKDKTETDKKEDDKEDPCKKYEKHNFQVKSIKELFDKFVEELFGPKTRHACKTLDAVDKNYKKKVRFAYTDDKGQIIELKTEAELPKGKKVEEYVWYTRPEFFVDDDMKLNKTIYEFNYDYIYSLKLFDTPVLVANIVNAILGLGFNSVYSINEEIIDGELSQIISDAIKEDEVTIDNSFCNFNSKIYNQMVHKADLKYAKKFQLEDTDNIITLSDDELENIKSNLDEIKNASTLEEQVSSIKKTFHEVDASVAKNPSIESKDSVVFGGFIVYKMLEETIVEMVMQVLSPKVALLYEINSMMFGALDEENLGAFKKPSINEYIDSMKNLIIAGINQVKGVITTELLKQVLAQIEKYGEKYISSLIQEQVDQYRKIFNELMKYYKLGETVFNDLRSLVDNRTATGIIIDDVKHADIVPKQTDPPKKINC